MEANFTATLSEVTLKRPEHLCSSAAEHRKDDASCTNGTVNGLWTKQASNIVHHSNKIAFPCKAVCLQFQTDL
jgi:hypothetical protein